MTRRSVPDWVAELVRADVRATAGYHVADAGGLVKLDAMENPFALPPGLRADLAQRLAAVELNRYPDPQAQALTRRLQQTFGVDPRWRIVLGNGSDEIIQILIAALATSGHGVLAPAPTFVMFRLIAQWLRVPFHEVPLAADFSLDMPAMLEAVRVHRPRVVFLACPNNPTGNIFAHDAVCTLIESCGALVVIDEAYLPFASRDHADLLVRYPNVVVMRTLSKLGLAGLRLGMLFGDPAWIDELDKLRLPYNIGTLNQVAAAVVLDHYEVLREQTAMLVGERSRLFAVLASDPRLEVWPSEANFLLIRLRAADARVTHERMRMRGVLVKCLDGSHPLLAGCLRATIGSAEENARMTQALRAALED